MWSVVQLTLPSDHLAQAESLLDLAGAVAVTLTDAGDTPLLEPPPGETPVWPQVCLEALFEQPLDDLQLARQLSAALGKSVALRQRALADADWQNAWRQHWQPLRFGDRLTVLPADDPPTHPDDLIIRLTPGLAFGTGQHPTTALCLQWLVDADVAGRTVCDFGAGSGLLAIAALKLGASHAYAIDIDPQALLACDQNALNNQVRPRLTIGLPENLTPTSTDIVIANILSEPLRELAAQLSARVKPRGDLVLSGILEHQASAVMAAYAAWFEFQPVVLRDGWVRLAARRRGDPV
jgi:ribosomal protein L11 methyltransferase